MSAKTVSTKLSLRSRCVSTPLARSAASTVPCGIASAIASSLRLALNLRDASMSRNLYPIGRLLVSCGMRVPTVCQMAA
jgi:hypothetical protein